MRDRSRLFVRVPLDLLADPELSAAAKLTLASVVFKCYQNPEIVLSLRELSRFCGQTIGVTTRAVDELVRTGRVEVDVRRGGHTGGRTVFRILRGGSDWLQSPSDPNYHNGTRRDIKTEHGESANRDAATCRNGTEKGQNVTRDTVTVDENSKDLNNVDEAELAERLLSRKVSAQDFKALQLRRNLHGIEQAEAYADDLVSRGKLRTTWRRAFMAAAMGRFDIPDGLQTFTQRRRILQIALRAQENLKRTRETAALRERAITDWADRVGVDAIAEFFESMPIDRRREYRSWGNPAFLEFAYVQMQKGIGNAESMAG